MNALANKEKDSNLETQKIKALKQEIEALKSSNIALLNRNTELNLLVQRTSHDFKSPVSSVLGVLFLLRKEDLSNRSVEYTNLIEKLMNQLNALMHSISVYNKIHLEESEFSDFCAIDVVNKAFHSLSEITGFDQINLKLIVESDFIIHSNLTLVEELLKAIICNSILYRSENEPFISVSLANNSDHIKIEIEDNGEGMEKDIASKAFDMFYRGNSKSKGTGLGLYLAKNIVDKFKGSIKISSFVHGTKVSIILPKNLLSSKSFSI